jgi:hypothetical protein
MRRPRGYIGENHQTIGSDILAVVRSLSLPELVLGAELSARVAAIDPAGWYPIGILLELMAALDKKVGPRGLKKMGVTLFRLSHEARVLEVVDSVSALLQSFDAVYRHANRGEHIGGWELLEFRPGYAKLDKTTPHHCVMEEGILARACEALGAPAEVRQLACFRQGADSCLYEITSSVTGPAWTG